MFSHTYDTCPLVVCDHEYCYFLPRFGLLHNTTHWGKIEGTRSLVLCLFSYSKHANGRIVFQVLLPFSPVRGELPYVKISESIALIDDAIAKYDQLMEQIWKKLKCNDKFTREGVNKRLKDLGVFRR